MTPAILLAALVPCLAGVLPQCLGEHPRDMETACPVADWFGLLGRGYLEMYGEISTPALGASAAPTVASRAAAPPKAPPCCAGFVDSVHV